ncbi:hypothetical protein Y1Q_0001944 [Alligator mississippiensis]|uniref:Uncharacterized protein n=1 Tax=Alligator mississippiensis TaxID=8496 RepID=A0A151PGI2_ALLMI|nr:hypothetical protein Y1Q_0001944 [Alligator mississippiensis]
MDQTGLLQMKHLFTASTTANKRQARRPPQALKQRGANRCSTVHVHKTSSLESSVWLAGAPREMHYPEPRCRAPPWRTEHPSGTQ